jgi:membrane protease subunit HflK
MAWNQPGEDKKRSPPRGNPDDSSLDHMLRRWQRQVQRLWRPGSGRGSAALVLIGLVVAVWLLSGVYQVDLNDRGVVQRFGRYVSIEQPGHGWHWPWPIETMTKVNVTLTVNGSEYKAPMLTSDQSLLDVRWSVQYRIADPTRYLFQLRDESVTLQQVSETVVRELVARYDLPALLVGDARGLVTREARSRIQQALDVYQAGIVVTGVNLTDLQLPEAVLAAQRDAAKADEDRRRQMEDANGYANDIVPKAQTQAQRQLAEAQVYAKQTLSVAQGETERFTELANAYSQAPEITRTRMYTETMEGILSRAHKIIIDAKSGGGNMIYLPLDKLAEAVRAANAAAAPSAPPSNGAATTSPGAATPATSATPAAASNAAAVDRSDQDERGRDRTDR